MATEINNAPRFLCKKGASFTLAQILIISELMATKIIILSCTQALRFLFGGRLGI